LVAAGVAAAGSAGIRVRAQARIDGLERRMSQRLDQMQQRHNRIGADVRYQTRAIAIAAAPVTDASAAEERDAPPALPAAEPSHPLLGAWRCSFRQQEFAYPPMACHIRRKDGGYFLEKTQGSQRIKGTITLQGDDRFLFSGLYFCPFGSCDAQTSGSFERKSRDHWVGKLREGGFETVVTLRRPKLSSKDERSAPTPKPRSAATRSAAQVPDPF
jgi:hypothetical protein